MRALARNLLAAALAAGFPACAAAADPALHALVVGIDRYRHGTSLQGAVSDARDIADALNGLGVAPTVLLDEQAKRDAVLDGLDRMLERTAPGDTVLFTYAGHGAQRPARTPALEADGLDEVLLLGGYSPAQGKGEFILDDEIHAWTVKADARGVRVLIVVDACHSGTLYRSPDKRADALAERVYDIRLPDLPAAGPAAFRTKPVNDARPPANTFSYAASQDNEKVREVLYASGVRGAFSIAFAQALRGGGDADRDGWLSHGELARHLLGTVRSLVGGIQNPNFEPPDRQDERLIRVHRAAVDRPPAAAALRLRTLGLPADRARALAAALPDVAAVSAGPADLIWDAGRREAVDASGDVVATDLAAEELPGLIDKVRALTRLKAVLSGSPLVMHAYPDDHAHAKGKQVGFGVDDTNGRALTLFSLAGNGKVTFLYPYNPNAPQRVAGDFRRHPLAEATSPFGADDVVALVTAEPAGALHAMLKGLDGRIAAGAAVDAALAAFRADPSARLGLQRIVTTP